MNAEIRKKRRLADQITLMEIFAPTVARRAAAGQFIILRVNEGGERIPLTIADYNREKGTVTIIYQVVGYTTRALDELNEGDLLCDFCGPLGNPTEIRGIKRAAVVGGGVGCAIAYPVAKALKAQGSEVDAIIGFRSGAQVILQSEFSAVSRVFVATEDASVGERGYVTDLLARLLDKGEKYDTVFAIGPLAMMKSVCELTKIHGIRTVVSMNPIMIDGTGMCGGCRLTVDGKTKFACVDGPDFDGHKVDFDSAALRAAAYREHECKLMNR